MSMLVAMMMLASSFLMVQMTTFSGVDAVTAPLVPSSPTNLTVEADLDGVYLNWTVPVDDGGSDIIEYRIYRWDNNTWPPSIGTWSFGPEMGPRLSAHLDAEYYFIYGGQTTFVYVTAVNANGESPKSNEVNITGHFRPWTVRLNSYSEWGMVTDWDNGSAYLEWSPPGDDGGFPITEYIVHRFRQKANETTGYPEYFDYHNVSVPSNQTTYVDDDLLNGVYYIFFVSAVNEIAPGWGFWYPVIPGTPTKVLDLSATAGDGWVNLTWSRPIKDCGSLITEYAVQRLDWSTPYPYEKMNFTVPGDMTFFNDTDARNGHQYNYAVAASNTLGGMGSFEGTSAIPHGIPPAPYGLNATWARDDGGAPYVLLEWSAPNSSDYSDLTFYIIKSGGLFLRFSVSTSQTSYTDYEVIEGADYSYQVCSNIDELLSDPTNKVTITPGNPIDAPQALFAVPGKGFMNLSWKAPCIEDGISGYNVYRGTGSGQAELIGSTSMDETSFNDTDQDGGMVYFYSVRAVKLDGESNPSTELEVTARGDMAGDPGPHIMTIVIIVAAAMGASAVIWLLLRTDKRNKLISQAVVVVVAVVVMLAAFTLVDDGRAEPRYDGTWEPSVGDYFEYGYETGELYLGMRVEITSIGDTTMTVNITMTVPGQEPVTMEQPWQKGSTMGMGLSQYGGSFDPTELFSGGVTTYETLATKWGYLPVEHKTMWLDEMMGMPVNMTLDIWEYNDVMLQMDFGMHADWGMGPPMDVSTRMFVLMDTNIPQILYP